MLLGKTQRSVFAINIILKINIDKHSYYPPAGNVFDESLFTVIDLVGRKTIESLAAKLTLLEREILNNSKAKIDINKEGFLAIKLPRMN